MSEPQIEVAIALVWKDGEILVSRRLAHQHLGGLWEFPGGKLAPGESPEAACTREVREEVGLSVRPCARRAHIEHAYPERRVRLYPIDCVYEGGELRALAVSDARFLPLERLAELEFPAANAALIAELLFTGPPAST